MKIAVFTYTFPHKKSQDTIWHLLSSGHEISLILAAEPVELNIPKATLRVKPRHIGLIPPKQIADNLGIRYVVTDHNSETAIQEVLDNGVELGVIGGARVLKSRMIDTFGYGVLNFHPGLIPWVRGLDALQWAIYGGHPLGVTAHLVDQRVDAGRIVIREEIPVHQDDTLIDLSLRLYEKEFELLPRAIQLCEERESSDFPEVEKSRYNQKMPPELEAQIPDILVSRYLPKAEGGTRPE